MKVNYTRSFYFSTLSVLLFLACKKDIGKAPVTATPTPVTVNACDTITYEKHIKPILTNACVSCHFSGSSIASDLSSYSPVKERVTNGLLKARVIEGSPTIMPQGGPKLPAAQLNLIQCWINNGAKEK